MARPIRTYHPCAIAIACFVLIFTVAATTAAPAATADALAKGSADYKSYAVDRIGAALSTAKQLQAAVKAGDVKAGQGAWIKSRRAWEAAEPITGEFFPKLDEAIDAWPDAKHGYHAIEAALFAGKLDGIETAVDALVANLVEFDKQLNAPGFQFTAQGLLNGAARLAYEIGENKSKGGESPYAGTSIIDMRENVEGIEAVFKVALEPALKPVDAKLAGRIDRKIEEVERLLGVKTLKGLDQPALTQAGEELAVLMQGSAGKLGLKPPKMGE